VLHASCLLTARALAWGFSTKQCGIFAQPHVGIIRIVLEGLRGEDSIAELCRNEGINQNLYYRRSKEFLEAGKKRRVRQETYSESEKFRSSNSQSPGHWLQSGSRDPEIDVLRLLQPIPGGIEALGDGKPRPRRIWNKISDKIETAIVNLAVEEPDLSPRELAVNFTDTKGSFCPKPPFIGSKGMT